MFFFLMLTLHQPRCVGRKTDSILKFNRIVRMRKHLSAVLFAAFAGSLCAHQQAFVSPDSFNLTVSVELVTMVVLGGLASTFGAVCGAIALTLLQQGLVVFEDYEMLIHGALLMAVMIFMPQGLFVGLSQAAHRVGHRLKRRQPLPST